MMMPMDDAVQPTRGDTVKSIENERSDDQVGLDVDSIILGGEIEYLCSFYISISGYIL